MQLPVQLAFNYRVTGGCLSPAYPSGELHSCTCNPPSRGLGPSTIEGTKTRRPDDWV